MEPDFSGWATKANLKCSDGRTIAPDAFAHMDGKQVPLVWQHGHNSPTNVLGYATLKALPEGVRADGFFNATKTAQDAKELVQHKDIKALSIYANNLQEKPGKQVVHGNIREVSLVLAGANPGAVIDFVAIKHSDDWTEELEDEAIIHTGTELFHADGGQPDSGSSDTTEPDLQKVWDSFTPEQQDAVNYIVGAAVAQAQDPDGDGDNDAEQGVEDDQKSDQTDAAHSGTNDTTSQEGNGGMTRNVFDQTDNTSTGPSTEGKHVMQHSDVKGFFATAQKLGSFNAALDQYALQHGVEPIDVLFPNYQNITQTPQFLSRRMEWVDGVLGACSKTPFSRVRTITADITMDEARAKGYIKGNLKREEWFSVSKRTTDPATIYKKQKMDRDDIIDITDFDIVSWIKQEMMVMLKEEIARAILIGDGRDIADVDKILDPQAASSGPGLRSIIHEHDLFKTDVYVNVGDADVLDPAATSTAYLAVRETILRAFRYYKGSGRPTFYTTIPVVNNLLLTKDQMGRYYWENEAQLAAALGVDSIVKVEVMETMPNLFGIIVNLSDYNLGSTKGGEISNFDFFDIDYNQYKYLVETRLSGALTKPKSALVLWATAPAATLVQATKPTFVLATGVVTIPTVTGVTYVNADTGATLTAGAQAALTNGAILNVRAIPADANHYIEETGSLASVWSFMSQGPKTGDTTRD